MVPIGRKHMPTFLISAHMGFFIRLPMRKFMANSAVSDINTSLSIIVSPERALTCTDSTCTWRRTFRKLFCIWWGLVIRFDAASSVYYGCWPNGTNFVIANSKSKFSLSLELLFVNQLFEPDCFDFEGLEMVHILLVHHTNGPYKNDAHHSLIIWFWLVQGCELYASLYSHITALL